MPAQDIRYSGERQRTHWNALSGVPVFLRYLLESKVPPQVARLIGPAYNRHSMIPNSDDVALNGVSAFLDVLKQMILSPTPEDAIRGNCTTMIHVSRRCVIQSKAKRRRTSYDRARAFPPHVTKK
jgi:hypothetical protein